MNQPRTSRRRPSCRVTPKIFARLLLFLAAALYATTLHATIEKHASPSSTTPPPKTLLRPVNSTDASTSLFLAQKWNLTTPHGPALLLRQLSLRPTYDPRSDFLHFHHIPKTGGTTLSDLLVRLFGPAVLPGSRRSEPFRLDAVPHASHSDYRVSFGHTRLRPIRGPNRTALSVALHDYFSGASPKKRMRSLAMLRDPTDLRASAYAMAMCAMNGRVDAWNDARAARNQSRACTSTEGLNLAELMHDYHAEIWKTCPNVVGGSDTVAAAVVLDKFQKKICARGPKAMEYCLSPSHLLASRAYSGMRSMYKSLLGRYFDRQTVGDVGYVTIENRIKRMHLENGIERIEEYVLIDLGGLDLVRYGPYDMEGFLSDGPRAVVVADSSEEYEPDVLWFGITERMLESTCLLFYVLGVKPIPVPRARVVQCSPAAWWSAEEREEVKRREEGDYAVWRAANAILDVRMMKMKREVREKLARKELGREERERLEALVDAGCLDFDVFQKV